MHRARELLAESDIKVAQVGRMVGYTSTPQFTRAFKAFFGTTPRAFRESIHCPRSGRG